MTPEQKKLFEAASRARENSHSPYSGLKVGAALRTSDGRIYSGCNVENSSYGGTICAERTAITKAISEQGKIQIAEILVVTDASPPWPPCGICRQVIAEFGAPVVHSTNLRGEILSESFDAIFPRAFTPGHLKK
jgi:cytidine deaminase